jgi:hypothetical protein
MAGIIRQSTLAGVVFPTILFSAAAWSVWNCRRGSPWVADASGRLALSIFQASRRQLPLTLGKLERHPLGSQAFIPLCGQIP